MKLGLEEVDEWIEPNVDHVHKGAGLAFCHDAFYDRVIKFVYGEGARVEGLGVTVTSSVRRAGFRRGGLSGAQAIYTRGRLYTIRRAEYCAKERVALGFFADEPDRIHSVFVLFAFVVVLVDGPRGRNGTMISRIWGAIEMTGVEKKMTGTER